MAIAALPEAHPGPPPDLARRVCETVALLERRGYSLPAAALGKRCLGGVVPEPEVRLAARAGGLEERDGIICSKALVGRTAALARRQAGHRLLAAAYRLEAEAFAVRLIELFPFVVAVSLAGSLASGGFAATDDVDLNLVVEDGYRHLAYFGLNALGVLHALRHRGKPVDALSARPLAPRVMTANLILERGQCFPLARIDADMAYELLAAEPLFGADFLAAVVAANPRLEEQFPQLRDRPGEATRTLHQRLPAWVYPRILEAPARRAGRAAWRYLQWTRRRHPEALARVAFVRRTMRPYTLFDDGL